MKKKENISRGNIIYIIKIMEVLYFLVSYLIIVFFCGYTSLFPLNKIHYTEEKKTCYAIVFNSFGPNAHLAELNQKKD